VAIAAVILAALVSPADRAALQSAWPALALLGLLNNAVPFALIFWSQIHIPSGLASILNATTPIFAVLVAHMTTQDEKLTAAKLAGVIAGLLGVAVMFAPDLQHEVSLQLWAQFACVGAALSYACASVIGRRVAHVHPLALAAGQFVAATILLAPVAALVDRPWSLPAPSTATIAALLALAVLASALAYVIYFRILARAGATNLMLVTLLIPISAILLGAAAHGEWPTLHQLMGMALITAALAAIDGRPLRRLARVVSLGKP
jgi:drug/metabolite transporter (DMT)-like permease